MRHRQLRGFTLVELLVVIGIIALLIGILLPTLSRVQEQSRVVKCSANLRSIGQGFAMYLAENQGVYPAAYIYNTGPTGPDVGGGTAAERTYGYTHWSWFLYSTAKNQNSATGSTVGQDAFLCPSFSEYDGGLPATNPAPGDFVDGQIREPSTNAGVIDQQVRRIAYTVNEAIIPRNKFSTAVEDGGRPVVNVSQYVKAGRIRESSKTILATEFIQNWRIISELDFNDPSFDGTGVVKSHRPVHGYDLLTGDTRSTNLNNVPGKNLAGAPSWSRGTAPPAVVSTPNDITNRLGWIGRNHGRSTRSNPARTNFLYCDGHVETKTIEETLQPKFEWGDRIYSLRGEPRVALQ